MPPGPPSQTLINVEILYFAGCPHAGDALALVREAVRKLGIDVQLIEREGDYPSPSVLVNGRDVMGETITFVRACRRDLPTAERVIAALRSATAGAPP